MAIAKAKLDASGPIVPIKLMLIAMRKYKGAAMLQLNGAQLLRKLGDSVEAMSDLPQRYRDAAVSVCATVLKVHSEKVDHIEESCNAIAAMFNAPCADSVDAKIVLTRVMESMNVDLNRAVLQKSIAIAIRTVTLAVPSVRAYWISLNGIPLSIEAINKHPALVGYHIAIWDIFDVILKDPTTRPLILEAGCFATVLMSMRYHYAHGRLTEVCCKLCRIAADLLPDSWPHVDWKEFTALIISAVHLHNNSALLVANCMACLCKVNIQTEDYSRIQFDGGAVGHACRALNLHLNDEEVQQWGHRLLWTMSDLFDEFSEPYFATGGVAPLLNAMDIWRSDVKMLEPVTGVLRNILGCEQFPLEQKFACLKVLLANMMKALEQGDDDFVAETCGVLSVLTSVEGDVSVEASVGEGEGAMTMAVVFGMLIQVLVRCDDPRGPQSAALLAMYNIFSPKGHRIYVSNGSTAVEEGEYKRGQAGYDQSLIDEFEAQMGWDALFKTLKICIFEPGTSIVGFHLMALFMSCNHLMNLLPYADGRLDLAYVIPRGLKQQMFVEQAQVDLSQAKRTRRQPALPLPACL